MGQAARRRLGLLRYPMLNEGVGQKASLYSLAALSKVVPSSSVYAEVQFDVPAASFFSSVDASSLESCFCSSFAPCGGSSLSSWAGLRLMDRRRDPERERDLERERGLQRSRDLDLSRLSLSSSRSLSSDVI
mmetsp:Transcript_46944/g.147107  ORF Transcript_46944/g.147107 Transcript_46944/m.147107 type:complete len:132 (-) Transcript_46944:581-976(-)